MNETTTFNPLHAAIPNVDQAYADAVPAHLQQSLADYFAKGQLPGKFLRAVLANDFMRAVCTADDTSLVHLPAIARFIANCAPLSSVGSSHALTGWQQRGGLKGGKL